MTCGACQATVRRATVVLNDQGFAVREHCVSCRPELYEGPRRDPSDQKIWIGPEYMPNRYRRVEDAHGSIWMPKDELIQDDHDAVSKRSLEDEQAAITSRELEAKKRATRRTTPMTLEEQLAALTKAREIAAHVERYHATIQ